MLIFTTQIESQTPLRETVYMMWHPSDEVIAVGSEGRLELIDLNTGQAFKTFENLSEEFIKPTWSHDGTRLAFTSSQGVEVWDRDTDSVQLLYQQTIPESGPYFLLDESRWSNDDRLVATWHNPERLEIWDSDTGQRVNDLQAIHNILDFLWLSNEQIITGGGSGLSIRWDLTTGEILGSFTVRSALQVNNPYVGSIALSPDERWLAVGAEDNSVRLWDLSLTGNISSEDVPLNPDWLQGRNLNRLFWFPIISVDWSPDGRYIAASSQSGVVYVWDFETRTLINDILIGGGATQVFSVSWSPYGGRLAYSSVPGKTTERWLNSPPARSIAGGNVEVIVPFPTIERLNAISESCILPEARVASVSDEGRLSEFVTTIEALSDEQIPAGCKADLLAVAEAIQATE